jgi:hypothetical protein
MKMIEQKDLAGSFTPPGKSMTLNRMGYGAMQLLSPVAVEKLHFSQKTRDLGDRKCLPKPRKSFVGLPNAKFFLPFSGESVFQQPGFGNNN